MPWRMMTYKALNTFIDDIFAFVIKMPTMYRIGCFRYNTPVYMTRKMFTNFDFRDDIVFFIFLYQRYIYKEDKSRVNEFGFSGDMLEEKDATPLENGDTKALENKKEEEEEGESLAVSESQTEASAGAWKNTQKQKSKKSKKVD